MSYYLLPKTNNNIEFNFLFDDNELDIYTSHSLFFQYREIYSQISKISDINTTNTVENVSKLMNPYEYIYSKVPGSKFSVSKLKPKTCVFYDFLELLNNSGIFDLYKNNNLKILHITPHFSDTIYCNELIRENQSDEFYFFNGIKEDLHEKLIDKKFDFIFVEIENSIFKNVNKYVSKLLEILKIILEYQNNLGSIIIKIDNVFYKPILDVIYILTSLYEKTSIVKPSTSNVITFEKYIICKNFIVDDEKQDMYTKKIFAINNFLESHICISNLNVRSIVSQEIPYYLLNKIDDMNVIIGQQQLEALNQIISVLKNKNKEEKIETIKKNNILKSVIWCEKFKIPCNKFSEKINIFLPVSKEINSFENYLLKPTKIEKQEDSSSL
jgi:hypothetical protein